MTEPVYYASYDPEDDKLRIYSDRASDELFARLRKLGYQRAPRQECFFAVWSPAREDLAQDLCGEIGPEDSTLADRAADRADRFEGYSENAGVRATAAYRRSNDLVQHIPMGQPVQPPGHHSRKGHINTLKKSRAAMGRAVKESDKSQHWAGRSEDVLAHVAQKFQPGAILRRIKKLEASRRKSVKARLMTTGDIYDLQKKWLDDNAPQAHDEPYLAVRARLGNLTAEKQGDVQRYLSQASGNRRAFHSRWIAHYDEQIKFWQSVYDAGPGNTRPDFDAMVKGGWVKCRWGWGQVVRVNKGGGRVTSVSLDKETMREPLPWGKTLVVKKDRIIEYCETDPLDAPFTESEHDL